MSIKTISEMIEVMCHYDNGGKIEITHLYNGNKTVCWKGKSHAHPVWNWEVYNYCIVLEKPSIDWSHVSDKYNYLAIDADGECSLFNSKPKVTSNRWDDDSEMYCIRADYFTSYSPGNCNWKDSLISRFDSKGQI